MIPRFDILTHLPSVPGVFVENLPFQIDSQPPDSRVIEKMVQDEVPRLLQSIQTYLTWREQQEKEALLHRICHTSLIHTIQMNLLTEQAAASCTDLVYDTSVASASALTLIEDQDVSPSPPGRVLASIAISLFNATIVSEGVNVHVSTEQWWAYRLPTSRLHTLATLIAGKTQTEARALLLRQPGIAGVFLRSSGNMPTDLRQIHLLVILPKSSP